MAQNGGEQGQQSADHNGAGAKAKEGIGKGITQCGAQEQQAQGAGDIKNVGIDAGGKLLADNAPDQGIDRNRDCGKQGQQISKAI